MSDLDPSDDPLVRQFIADGIDEKPARIQVAALRLFANQGYAATSVRDIVETADVTNPMLYYYFDSKHGLFTSLIDHLFESIAEDVEAIVDEPTPIEVVLETIATTYFEACRDFPDVLRFIYSVLCGPRESRPDFTLPEAYQHMLGQIQERLRKAIGDGELSPPRGFDSTFLTERFMGLVDNQLMGAFALASHGESWHDARASIDDFVGPSARTRILHFFFAGAGHPDFKEFS